MGRFVQIKHRKNYYYGILKGGDAATKIRHADGELEFPTDEIHIRELHLCELYVAPELPVGGPDLLVGFLPYPTCSEFAPDLRSYTLPNDRELRLWEHPKGKDYSVKSDWWNRKVEQGRVVYHLNDYGFPYWIVKLDVGRKRSNCAAHDEEVMAAEKLRRNFLTEVAFGYWNAEQVGTPPYSVKSFTDGTYHYYVFGPRLLKEEARKLQVEAKKEANKLRAAVDSGWAPHPLAGTFTVTSPQTSILQKALQALSSVSSGAAFRPVQQSNGWQPKQENQ